VHDPIPISAISSTQEILQSKQGRIVWLEALATPTVDIDRPKPPKSVGPGRESKGLTGEDVL